MSNDNVLSKGIDGTLKRQCPEKYKGHHSCHGKSGSIQRFDLTWFKLKVRERKTENRIPFKHIDQAYERGKRLG